MSISGKIEIKIFDHLDCHLREENWAAREEQSGKLFVLFTSWITGECVTCSKSKQGLKEETICVLCICLLAFYF